MLCLILLICREVGECAGRQNIRRIRSAKRKINERLTGNQHRHGLSVVSRFSRMPPRCPRGLVSPYTPYPYKNILCASDTKCMLCTSYTEGFQSRTAFTVQHAFLDCGIYGSRYNWALWAGDIRGVLYSAILFTCAYMFSECFCAVNTR